MPYGQTSYMSAVDFSIGYVERLALTGAVKFCERPPAADPKWVLIATDIGEIRVFNEAGVHLAAYDIDLGWNPSQVSINNDDPPKILIRRHSTLAIYLYESGSESWNVAGITNMNEALISEGYVHVLLNTGVGGSCGPQWRSLTDGSIVQAARGGAQPNAYGMSVTEAGEIVYWENQHQIDGRIWIRKEDRTAGNQWNREMYASASPFNYGYHRSKCSADGSLVFFRAQHPATGNRGIRLTKGSNGNSLFTTTSATLMTIEVNPAGTRALYLLGNVLHKLTLLGAHTQVTMGATRGADEGCLDVTDDPYFIAVLNNGDIEIYDDSLAKKATIDYDLSDTPIAVVRRT